MSHYTQSEAETAKDEKKCGKTWRRYHIGRTRTVVAWALVVVTSSKTFLVFSVQTDVINLWRTSNVDKELEWYTFSLGFKCSLLNFAHLKKEFRAVLNLSTYKILLLWLIFMEVLKMTKTKKILLQFVMQ